MKKISGIIGSPRRMGNSGIMIKKSAAASLNEENRSTAAKLSHALFNPVPEPTGSRCPVCGGDSFRLLGGADFRCLLCSNQGTMDMNSGTPVIHIERSNHEMFLSKADLIKHKDWLMGMKSQFMAKKDALKAVSVKYREGGNWIKPPELNP
jgi:hypothetical protein